MTNGAMKRPVKPGAMVDFVALARTGALIDVPNRLRDDPLASVEGPEYYGQWGVYLVRLLPDLEPPAPQVATRIVDVSIVVGAELAGEDVQVTDLATQSVGISTVGMGARGLAVAVSGDQVRVTLKSRPFQDASAAFRITTIDAVTCWIAPYAPKHYRVPFDFVMSPLMTVAPFIDATPVRIPPFAQSMYVRRATESAYPVPVYFVQYRDSSLLTAQVAYTASADNPGSDVVPIPPFARYVAFSPNPSEPVRPTELQRVYGYFDCWG